MEYPSSAYFATHPHQSYEYCHEQPGQSGSQRPMLAGGICHSPVAEYPPSVYGGHEAKFDVDVKVKRAFSFEELQSGSYFERLDESDFEFFRVYGQPVLIPLSEETDGSFALHNHTDKYLRTDGSSCDPFVQSALRTDNCRILISKSYTLENPLGECATQVPSQSNHLTPQGAASTTTSSHQWQPIEQVSCATNDAAVTHSSDPSSSVFSGQLYSLHGHQNASMTAITTASASGVQYVDQKPMFATYDEQPPMDSLPYPPPPNFQPSPTPQDGVVLGAPSYIHNAPFQISTSNEEWEDVPAPPPRLTVPSQPYMLSELPSPSQTAFSLPQHEQYTSSSYSHSRRRRSRSPSPRSQLRMSPIPHTKRSLDKKPALACLFCRGRKIACGPPSPGSKDKTCNQCLRRHLKCEYPLESRRGMRKRRSLVPRATSATPELSQGPKVHLTKANRKRSTEKAS